MRRLGIERTTTDDIVKSPIFRSAKTAEAAATSVAPVYPPLLPRPSFTPPPHPISLPPAPLLRKRSSPALLKEPRQRSHLRLQKPHPLHHRPYDTAFVFQHSPSEHLKVNVAGLGVTKAKSL
jgi:hypothetical protein